MTDLTFVATAEEANRHEEYRNALVHLLYTLADDNFILAYRGSEWLALGPNIEADVAFSSICQDTLGHAVFFYELLEELGEGKADDLAQLREPSQFCNAVFVERPNGTGAYLDNPHYDWAYNVVRHYVYSVFQNIRLEALSSSSYSRLAQAARKMTLEQKYHLLHWRTWLKQLAHSTDDARIRLIGAFKKAWEDVGGLLDMGEQEQPIASFGLIDTMDSLRQRFYARTHSELTEFSLPWPGEAAQPAITGRDGRHSEELATVIETLSEVYRIDPATKW